MNVVAHDAGFEDGIKLNARQRHLYNFPISYMLILSAKLFFLSCLYCIICVIDFHMHHVLNLNNIISIIKRCKHICNQLLLPTIEL